MAGNGPIVALLSGAVFLTALYYGLRQVQIMRKYGGGRVDRQAWQYWAAENGIEYIDVYNRPTLQGVVDGASVQVVATLTDRWNPFRRHGAKAAQYARTSIRVSVHAAVPPGLLVHRRRPMLTMANWIVGGRAIRTERSIDAFFRVQTRAPERTREILADLDLQNALRSLAEHVPDAIVTENAVLLELPGMISDTRYLERSLRAMAGVAVALGRAAPRAALAGPDRAPLPSAAQLPPLRASLLSALGRITPGASTAAVATAKIAPLEYEIEVRSVHPAVSRLGIGKGGRILKGNVYRSRWRVEIAFDAEYDAFVDDLSLGDVVTGMVEIDELRTTAQIAEGKALGPPFAKIRARGPVPDGGGPPVAEEAAENAPETEEPPDGG